jgi:hypothetical protein
MSVAFRRGTTTGPSDLSITIRDTLGSLIDPYRLQYAVFDKTTGIEVLVGSPVNLPIKISTGQYYAQIVIPADGNIGDWLVRWTIQETSTDPVYQSVQLFSVVGDSAITSFTGNINYDKLIYSLRILLRDNNPDRNYRFRPPASEKFIQGQTQVFGFIWEDEEMLEYLYLAVDDFNTRPPVTGITIDDLFASMGRWKTAILLRAASFACFAIAMNWIADEFSIDGGEQLKIRIGQTGNEIEISISLLFTLLYADALRDGKLIAREGMIEAGIPIEEKEDDDFNKVMLGKYTVKEFKNAYKTGALFIQAMTCEEEIIWAPISQVMRHECPQKKLLKIKTEIGEVIITEDHSLFAWLDRKPLAGKEIYPGLPIVGLIDNILNPVIVLSVEEMPSKQYMYDLSVPYAENFFLSSGILAHNSYSISGVSLDIEKSSKYQSMKDEFIGEYDKVVEAAKRSIKIIKGLRQFRYGIGITSALGPLSRPGIQSRRNFIEGGGSSWS